jgi:NADH-quinone oxidoreductase subunit C
MMTASQIFERLRAQFGDAIFEIVEENFDPFITIKSDIVCKAIKYLKNKADLAFDFLALVTAIDYPDENRIQVVYHLYSYKHHHKIVIKADVPRDKPEIPSIARIYGAADWHEREQYDLIGVIFTDHPDFRRILCVEDWEGHPLRKDYVEPETYHGIPTQADWDI